MGVLINFLPGKRIRDEISLETSGTEQYGYICMWIVSNAMDWMKNAKINGTVGLKTSRSLVINAITKCRSLWQRYVTLGTLTSSLDLLRWHEQPNCFSVYDPVLNVTFNITRTDNLNNLRFYSFVNSFFSIQFHSRTFSFYKENI